MLDDRRPRKKRVKHRWIKLFLIVRSRECRC